MGEVRSVRVNIGLIPYRMRVCQIIHAENRYFSVSQVMISDRFSYRYRIIAVYGALNCLDYYESLNLGILNNALYQFIIGKTNCFKSNNKRL